MTVLRFIPALVLALVLAFAPTQSHAAVDATASPEEAVHSESATTSKNDPGPAFVTPEAGAPGAAAEEHGEGGLPQLNATTYPSQIFWLLVMFVVMYVAFSKKILPNIGSVVNARESMIKGNLETAERLKHQAEDVKTSYEKNLDAARAQAIKAVQDVELAAKKKAADQVESFRKKADGDMKAAEERVLVQKDKAMGDMAHVAAEVASVAAEKITGISTDMQKAKAIVDSIAAKKRPRNMIELLQNNVTLWVAISFALFVILAVKLGGKGILAALDNKIAQIKSEIETAERLKQEAQALLADFQTKQRDAEKAAGQIIEQAKASALAVQKAAEADLSESMERREAQLAERLQRIEQKAIADIQNHAADLALKATREIVEKTLDEKAGTKLVDQAIQSVAKYLN